MKKKNLVKVGDKKPSVDIPMEPSVAGSTVGSPLRDRYKNLIKKDLHESRLKLASLAGESWSQEGTTLGKSQLFACQSEGSFPRVNELDDPSEERIEQQPTSPVKNRNPPSNNSGGKTSEKEGLYSMLTKDNTWQQIGKTVSPFEKPASRRDILLLKRQFDRAMHTSQREIRLSRKSGTGLMAESRMEQDVVATKEKVRETLRPTIDPWELDPGDDSQDEEIKNSVGYQTDKNARAMELQSTLAAALFEQKWTDLVLGELQEQILVTCLEQGKLLYRIRTQLATCFALVCTAQSMTVHDLGEMTKLMIKYKTVAQQLSREQQTLRDDLNKEMQIKLIEFEDNAQAKYTQYELEIKEVQASERRMAETLQSLNAVYKKMREDADVVRALEVKEACAKLESRLEVAYSELDELRPLRQQKEDLTNRVERQEETISELKERVTKLEQEVEQREALVQDLMQNHSAKLSKEELQREDTMGVKRPSISTSTNQTGDSSMPEAQNDSDDEECLDSDDEIDSDPDDTGENDKAVVVASPGGEEALASPSDKKGKKKSKRNLKRKKKAKKKGDKFLVGKKILKATDTVQVEEGAIPFNPGEAVADDIREGMDDPSTAKTILCPRCNIALDKAGNIDERFLDQEKPVLACQGYRMLLPNLMGYRPDRPRHWVLRCMRSLVKAKRVADFTSQRNGTKSLRFPEFVYMWFSPRLERLEELKESEGNEAVIMAKAQADENRWGFYYGIKKLSTELPEARVFYTFLDEKYGADDFAFYLHCLTVMEAVANEKRSTFDWGFNTSSCDYDALEQTEEEQGGSQEINDFIFIEIKHAAIAVERVMSRASPEDNKRAVKTLLENAVQEEIRITPTTGQRVIDINVCLRVLLQEYRDEQAHRRAALRLMFGCASAGKDDQISNKSVDLGQLLTIVKSLNSRAGSPEAVTLYRIAHEIGGGKVTVDSFSTAAERTGFLTDCLRLPSHYGTEAPNELTISQCVQIGTNVRQQMALMRPVIELYSDMIDPPAKRTLAHLAEDVHIELEKGGIQLDGRRALCAMRRLLYFMVGQRNAKRELFGEQEKSGDVAVVNIKKEIESLCLLLRDFAADAREERLQALQLKNSASLIQQRWRKRQELAPGVPHDMRKLLSVCFEPGLLLENETSAEGQPKVVKRKRLPRAPHHPMELVLITIEEVYRYKLHYDCRLMALRQVIGHEDSPSLSRSTGLSLENALHSVVLRLFGVRSFAERFIHDFFVNVHKFAMTNLRIRLFARFTGVRSPALQRPNRRLSALDAETSGGVVDVEHEVGYGLLNDWSNEPMSKLLPKALQNPDAIDTYVIALGVLHSGEGPLLPPYAEGESTSWIPLEKAIAALKQVLNPPGSHRAKYAPCGANISERVVEECMTRLERVDVEKGNVELDKVLLIVLQGWHSEQIYRKRGIFESLTEDRYEDDTKVALKEIHSYGDFHANCASLFDQSLQAKPVTTLALYRTLITISDPKPTLLLEDVQDALEKHRLCAWGPPPAAYTNCPPVEYGGSCEDRWKLLVFYWSSLEKTIEPTLSTLGDISRAKFAAGQQDRNQKTDDSVPKENEDREEELREQRMNHVNYLFTRAKAVMDSFVNLYLDLVSKSSTGRTDENVENAWSSLRVFLSVLQHIRIEIGVADEPLKDQFDLDRMEGKNTTTTNKKRRKTKRKSAVGKKK